MIDLQTLRLKSYFIVVVVFIRVEQGELMDSGMAIGDNATPIREGQKPATATNMEPTNL